MKMNEIQYSAEKVITFFLTWFDINKTFLEVIPSSNFRVIMCNFRVINSCQLNWSNIYKHNKLIEIDVKCKIPLNLTALYSECA